MPSLEPLLQSHDDNATEAALKDAFVRTFEAFLREAERELNLYGTPHLGSLDLMARFIKQDGLALIRKNEPSMGYLFRAWRARNRMRGLHFLRTYLQLLWSNAWTAEQMWQDARQPYPTALVGEAQANQDPVNHFLTSRIHVAIEDFNEDGQGILKALPSLRTTLGAKYLLNIFLLRRFVNSQTTNKGIHVANGLHSSGVIELIGKACIARTNLLQLANAHHNAAIIEIKGVAIRRP
jgi:hypothetical protein